MPRGNFIVFEGLDGSGKTTQMHRLYRELRGRGINCTETREPSEGLVGMLARSAIKKKTSFTNNTLALLFAADRSEHIEDEILPLIRQGISVLCDRYYFSNLAYQGHALPMETILQYNKASISALRPDMTLYIDVSPEECMSRQNKSRFTADKYETPEQQKAVYRRYADAFQLFSDNEHIVMINGTGDENEVFERIWLSVSELYDKSYTEA